MSIAIARIDDPVAAGKIISTPSGTVFINKKPVALMPATVTPHGDNPHAAATITTGKIGRLKIDKRQPVGDGDVATCGDTVQATQKTVLAK